uniref:Helicase Sen1 N-terminal domain-containing protein n=1 Tax=Eptatretus burgeri TaxID=7764 RepID=A0A8C4QFU2_EPTBU
MVTCQWCTAEGTKLQTSDCVPCETFLMAYANGHLDDEKIEAADDDLSYCFDCVTAYHHARRVVVAQSNCLNEVLSQRECYRLSTLFTRTLKDFQNAAQEVFLLDQGEEQRVGGEGVDLELALRTPIMEILENPFLLNHLDVATHLVEALCYLETLKQPFQVDYYTHPPGVYLLILHPQEEVRRWALRSAQQLGHLSRDDYYGLRDVFLTVLNLIHSIVSQRNVGSGGGCVTALPPHLFTSANKKNFWLGVCMLLTLLDQQAMETLLLDQAPQTNILEAILSAMEMTTEDESQDPFWPTLQCLMVMLDRLGAKVWAGQNVDPMHAFHRVINSPNYRREVEKVSPVRVKQEALQPDVMSCSQIVYGADTSISVSFFLFYFILINVNPFSFFYPLCS